MSTSTSLDARPPTPLATTSARTLETIDEVENGIGTSTTMGNRGSIGTHPVDSIIPNINPITGRLSPGSPLRS